MIEDEDEKQITVSINDEVGFPLFSFFLFFFFFLFFSLGIRPPKNSQKNSSVHYWKD